MANALTTLFGEIAQAIRDQNGDPETVKYKPAQFPEKIANLSGGGSAAGTVTVTFLNYDGVELFSRLVFIGDDCPDPVSQGKLTTPTRESTNTTVYTHSGWSLTIGTSASASALKNITANRTVYAAYTESTRYYTIRYYDGTTLLKTENLVYGATPSFVPMKDGYSFSGWTPSISTVTSDIDYQANWSTKVSFSGATWKDIAEVCESGNAANNFAVGDTRTVQMTLGGNTYDMELEIIGINHDDLSDGSGKAGITIGTKNSLFGFEFNLAGSSQSNYKFPTGWAASQMRTAYNSTLIDAFPSEMTQHIKTVTKRSIGPSNTLTDIVTSSDKMFVPSVSEFTGYNHDTGAQYAHYKNVNNRKKYRQGKSSLTTAYTPYGTRIQNPSNSSTYIYGIEDNGNFTGAVHSIEAFVVCFCI